MSSLVGRELPDLMLESSRGRVNVRDFGVIYVYPETGRPGRPMPEGWDDVPGARGCTPQSCAFRDLHDRFPLRVAGLSGQPLDDQIEFAEREHMPFPVVADPDKQLGAALDLPTFELGGRTFYERLTLVAPEGRVEKVFHPIERPDENAGEVLAWLEARQL
jgi:peroxiredoxin